MWYESKVKYINGLQKKVTETYLVDALSFTEAEARTIEFVSPYVSEDGELEVVGLKQTTIKEVLSNSEGDKWFVCNFVFHLMEDNGKDKQTKYSIMVQANTNDKRKKPAERFMIGPMQDREMKSITETKILNVFTKQANKGHSKTDPHHKGRHVHLPKVQR